FSTGEACRDADDFERRNHEHQERVLELAGRCRSQGPAFDLIHDMSGSFWERAAQVEAPVLATLHLPRDFYPPPLFEDVAANVSFNCVSATQAGSFAELSALAGTVGNGIDLGRFAQTPRPDPAESHAPSGARSGLLWLGRICNEKAPHVALEMADRAGMAIILAGQVYPFSYHQRYFED